MWSLYSYFGEKWGALTVSLKKWGVFTIISARCLIASFLSFFLCVILTLGLLHFGFHT